MLNAIYCNSIQQFISLQFYKILQSVIINNDNHFRETPLAVINVFYFLIIAILRFWIAYLFFKKLKQSLKNYFLLLQLQVMGSILIFSTSFIRDIARHLRLSSLSLYSIIEFYSTRKTSFRFEWIISIRESYTRQLDTS